VVPSYLDKNYYMMKKFFLISLILGVLVPNLFSQRFNVISKVDSVLANGFYRILLFPELISYSNADYSDIRLFNSKGKEVPYLLKEESFITSVSGFNEYTLLENKYFPEQKLTRVRFENPVNGIISTLGIVVRNTEIDKEITLKGSDNKTDWYVIQKRSFILGEKFDETSQIITLNFPGSNFKYFEFSINDKKKDPIQVLKVGSYSSQQSLGTYTPVPVKEIHQTDSSDKKSYIRIKFNIPFELSRIELEVGGPELYQRNCLVGQYIDNKGVSTFETTGQFEINSNKPVVWETNKLKVQDLTLIIENFDNAPLKINTVKAFQLNKYLIAKLEKNEVYTIKTGNPDLTFPDYDLKYFSENIPEELVILKSQRPSVSSVEKTQNSKTIFTSTILWAVIILIIGLLGFFSIKMVREMGKKN
jgi:hypothetical protein